jgi:ribosome recycling factor
MAYDFSKLKKEGDAVLAWLASEYKTLRTGRASPGLIEKVVVDIYGAKTPIEHVAAISVEDAKTLRIAPWDKSTIGPIQTAIDKANLGVSCSPDDRGLRVIVPALTEESRKGMVRLVGERLEAAKITLRKLRDEVQQDIAQKEKDKVISEDDRFRHKEEMQKLIDGVSEKLEALAKTKEEEMKTI